MRVHTQALHFNADQNLLSFIEGELAKLERFFDRIIDADVVLKIETSGALRHKIAEIRVTLPGSVLFVRECSQTFEASIDSAASALKRQLVRYKDRRRGKR